MTNPTRLATRDDVMNAIYNLRDALPANPTLSEQAMFAGLYGQLINKLETIREQS